MYKQKVKMKQWAKNTKKDIMRIKEGEKSIMGKEKGSVTLYITIMCIVLIVILSLIVFNIMNKNNNQKKQLDKISDNYSVSSNDMEQAYEEAGGEQTRHVTLEEMEELIQKTRDEVKAEMQEEFQKKLNDMQTTVNNSITNAKEQVKLETFPIGSIFISTTNTNPSSYIGGTWTSYGEGRTLIGAGTGKDINNNSQAFAANTTGGEYKHKLTIAEMPSHSHTYSIDLWRDKGFKYIAYYIIEYSENSSGVKDPGIGPSYEARWFTGARNGTLSIDKTGGDGYHNNIQPYIVTYIWKRTG